MTLAHYKVFTIRTDGLNCNFLDATSSSAGSGLKLASDSFLQTGNFFYLFTSLAMLWDLWDLSSPPGIEPGPWQ